MKVSAAGVKLTWDDLLQFPDDGKRHEIIDGEHFVMATPVIKHQAIVRNMTGFLWSYLREHPVGRVYPSPLDVILSNHDVVEPDLIVVSNERARALAPSPWLKGVPSLVVEVESPSTRKRDLSVKRRLYERFGVDEYWVVDPELEVVKVFRREGDAYGRPVEFSLEEGGVLTTPLVPGLELPLAVVFEE